MHYEALVKQHAGFDRQCYNLAFLKYILTLKYPLGCRGTIIITSEVIEYCTR